MSKINMDAECSTTVQFSRSSKPILTIGDIKDVLGRRYGIRTSVVKEYESYGDRAYYVKTEPGHGIGQKTEFVAKVLNSEYTAIKGAVAVQTDILNHLKSFPELGCQSVVPNLDGNLLSYEMIPSDLRDGWYPVRARLHAKTSLYVRSLFRQTFSHMHKSMNQN